MSAKPGRWLLKGPQLLTYVAPQPCPLKRANGDPDPQLRRDPRPRNGKGRKLGHQDAPSRLHQPPGLGWSSSGSAPTSWPRPPAVRFGARLCCHLIGHYVVVRRCDWKACLSITLGPAGLRRCCCNRGGAGAQGEAGQRVGGAEGGPVQKGGRAGNSEVRGRLRLVRRGRSRFLGKAPKIRRRNSAPTT